MVLLSCAAGAPQDNPCHTIYIIFIFVICIISYLYIYSLFFSYHLVFRFFNYTIWLYCYGHQLMCAIGSFLPSIFFFLFYSYQVPFLCFCTLLRDVYTLSICLSTYPFYCFSYLCNIILFLIYF